MKLYETQRFYIYCVETKKKSKLRPDFLFAGISRVHKTFLFKVLLHGPFESILDFTVPNNSVASVMELNLCI